MLSIVSKEFGIALVFPQYGHSKEISYIANSKDISENVGSVGEFPYPYSEADAINFIDSAISQYELGYGYSFEVIPSSVNLPVGIVGLRNVEKSSNSAEMGFWIGERYRSRGYAKSALKMLLEFGFSKLKLHRIYATALKTNEKSLLLMKSLGLKHEGVLRESAITKYGPKDKVILSILDREFEEVHGIAIKE